MGATKRQRLGKAKAIDGFIKDIKSRPLVITEFDEKLWLAVNDTVMVAQDGTIEKKKKNASEITA